MRRLLTATALLLPIILSAQAQADPVYAWQGSRSVVKDKHLIPAMKKGEGYGEKWTFNANFGDRGSMYYSLTISNMGMGDHKMEAKGRLTLDGEKIAWKKKLDDDEWSYSKGKLNIKAGPAHLFGTPKKLELHAKGNGGKVECTFTPIANAWRANNGQIQFGEDRDVSDFTTFPLMKAVCRHNKGGEWTTAEGRGHGTRTWADLAIYDQARWNFTFRGEQGDYTVHIRELGLTKDYGRKRVAYLLVTKGSDILIESYDYALKATDVFTDTKTDNNYKVPTRFTLVGKDAEDGARQFRGSVTKKKQRKREDMLKRMNSAVRLIAERYSKPMLYSYDSDFHIQVKTATGVEDIKGTGRYEFYHWNK
jgi:hypothetical protein